MKPTEKYPSLNEIKNKAQSRLPRFIWEYLDSATGSEFSKYLDRNSFDNIQLKTEILRGQIDINHETKFLDQYFKLPFGIGPVGMSGLIYPNAETMLGQYAGDYNIPYTLPTLGTNSIEDLNHIPQKNKWFQLYCPKDLNILEDLLARALQEKFDTLVVTIDLPAPSVRERQLKSGLSLPPKVTPSIMLQLLARPIWALSFLFNRPNFKTLDRYSKTKNVSSVNHLGYQMRINPDIKYLKLIRKLWPNKLIVKGITNDSQVKKIIGIGVDALWVSNHGGRQFQSGVSSIDTLKNIRAVTNLPIVFDGGLENGLDIIKSYACGADFVMLSRPWHYGLAAFGKNGPSYIIDILDRDLVANMSQMGVSSVSELNSNHIW
jgi:L-lactate dehydrogenase (cytochrome)